MNENYGFPMGVHSRFPRRPVSSKGRNCDAVFSMHLVIQDEFNVPRDFNGTAVGTIPSGYGSYF